MIPLLYLVATPIGNLADFTFRAVTVLKECDYILCEDTRHSLILLRHYEITKPLKSYHKFSEERKKEEIIQDLQGGKVIALLSDAGTPCIADPGWRLVTRCQEVGIPVVPIPGPCALITAIIASGFPTDRFQFASFLPKKSGGLERELLEAFKYPGVTIFYESPYRIKKVLEKLHQLVPEREVAIARELTKKFEEILRATPQAILAKYKERTFKGEIVLMVQGQEE